MGFCFMNQKGKFELDWQWFEKNISALIVTAVLLPKF